MAWRFRVLKGEAIPGTIVLRPILVGGDSLTQEQVYGGAGGAQRYRCDVERCRGQGGRCAASFEYVWHLLLGDLGQLGQLQSGLAAVVILVIPDGGPIILRIYSEDYASGGPAGGPGVD